MPDPVVVSAAVIAVAVFMACIISYKEFNKVSLAPSEKETVTFEVFAERVNQMRSQDLLLIMSKEEDQACLVLHTDDAGIKIKNIYDGTGLWRKITLEELYELDTEVVPGNSRQGRRLHRFARLQVRSAEISPRDPSPRTNLVRTTR